MCAPVCHNMHVGQRTIAEDSVGKLALSVSVFVSVSLCRDQPDKIWALRKYHFVALGSCF